MAGAMSGLFKLMQLLQVVFFYGVLGVIVIMLYRVSKELGEIKRSIVDLQEHVALAQIPRAASADRAEGH